MASLHDERERLAWCNNGRMNTSEAGDTRWDNPVAGGNASPARSLAERNRSPAPGDHNVRDGLRNRGRKSAGLIDALVILALCVLFTFGVVRPFVVEPRYVPTESMAPTLVAGDRVVTAKFVYFLDEPRRGDLALLKDPEGRGVDLIKRVVGLPGDTVEIRDGALYVNGERKRESYVNYRLTDGTFFGPLQVPEERVFVMSDNRANSRDSREFGPMPEEDLLGKVILRFSPPERFGRL